MIDVLKYELLHKNLWKNISKESLCQKRCVSKEELLNGVKLDSSCYACEYATNYLLSVEKRVAAALKNITQRQKKIMIKDFLINELKCTFCPINWGDYKQCRETDSLWLQLDAALKTNNWKLYSNLSKKMSCVKWSKK